MRLGTTSSYAQGLRFFALAESTFYAPDVIRSIKERYGFVRVPETPDEIMPMGQGKPMVFQHGKYLQPASPNPIPIVIRTLQLYRQGVTVDVNNDFTDQCDVVLDDFLSWFPLIQSRMETRFYLSRLEVTFDHPVENAWPGAMKLAAMISHKLAGYGPGPTVDFRVSTLAVHQDPGLVFRPGDFRIEKREGVPYDQNVYFSQAPLATNDHIEMLAYFERLLSDAAPSTDPAPDAPGGFRNVKRRIDLD